MKYDEVARLFRKTTHTIMRWVREGRLPSPRYFGSSALFPSQEIEQIALVGLPKKNSFIPVRSPNALIGQLGVQAKARKSTRRAPGRRKRGAK